MFRTIAILSCTGGIAHANPLSQVIHADGVRTTHLYHNAATGETIASKPVAARGATPALVWQAEETGICAGFGLVVRLADDPADPDRFGLIHMDWGDIAPGTVLSMIQFGVATDYPDADLNGDGFPDGVPGLGVGLAFFAGENGAGGGGGASVEVGEVILTNLPGNPTPSGFAAYVFTVDLAGGVSLGSTDVDGDGLADFGYSIEYLHPPADDQPPRRTYLMLGAPSGQAVPDGAGEGGWTIIPDPAPNAQGATDAIDIYRRDIFGQPEFVETIGGDFSCEPGAIGAYAQIAISLFEDGAAAGCAADLFPPSHPDGQLNFLDLAVYLGLFNAQDPGADFFPPGGDGQINLFDLSAYIAAFNAGCP